ncbi:hypothetical protein Ccrd_003260 [Cynara cardunculus var. scolymus]|uniref:Uncharacterized protein n=1 Tax=Cynara cardunculus var. scolymus TaxID=59895 RepID=A0A124SCS2_CYNCS|nr:hypothetical protein Ccrd_003260 [Cynara cardunculus var. scolymus]
MGSTAVVAAAKGRRKGERAMTMEEGEGGCVPMPDSFIFFIKHPWDSREGGKTIVEYSDTNQLSSGQGGKVKGERIVPGSKANGKKASAVAKYTTYEMYRRIIKREVKDVPRKMGKGKTIGSDKILIKAWMCLGRRGA